MLLGKRSPIKTGLSRATILILLMAGLSAFSGCRQRGPGVPIPISGADQARCTVWPGSRSGDTANSALELLREGPSRHLVSFPLPAIAMGGVRAFLFGESLVLSDCYGPQPWQLCDLRTGSWYPIGVLDAPWGIPLCAFRDDRQNRHILVSGSGGTSVFDWVLEGSALRQACTVIEGADVGGGFTDGLGVVAYGFSRLGASGDKQRWRLDVRRSESGDWSLPTQSTTIAVEASESWVVVPPAPLFFFRGSSRLYVLGHGKRSTRLYATDLERGEQSLLLEFPGMSQAITLAGMYVTDDLRVFLQAEWPLGFSRRKELKWVELTSKGLCGAAVSLPCAPPPYMADFGRTGGDAWSLRRRFADDWRRPQ